MIPRSLLLAAALVAAPAIAQTQLEMNTDACAEYQQADKKLNDTYQQVMQRHKGDAAFVAKMKKAQRAWIAYRDAELGAIYPAQDQRAEYGSAFPMCQCSAQSALVNQRIEQLSQWLADNEGDACRGSR